PWRWNKASPTVSLLIWWLRSTSLGSSSTSLMPKKYCSTNVSSTLSGVSSSWRFNVWLLWPSNRPWRMLSCSTTAFPCRTSTAKTSALAVSSVVSTYCFCCISRNAAIWSRISAARSKASCSEAWSICASSSARSLVSRPSKKSTASCTCSAYSASLTLPTQGAVQRLIWYCRHGLVRCLHIELWQLRNLNTFSSTLSASFILATLG